MSDSGDDHDAPPPGVRRLAAEDDYFVKQNEFRIWLRDRGKYMDELDGKSSRKYFKKFVKAWNRGKLPSEIYLEREVDALSSSASANTAYRWSFTKTETEKDRIAVKLAKASVAQATSSSNSGATGSRSDGQPAVRARLAGPTMPSAGDWTVHQEELKERDVKYMKHARKREREEDRDRIEDITGPRETGREGMLEKKRVKREADRQMRDKDDAGPELGDDALYGGGDSFQRRLAQRDTAKRRAEEKKQANRMEPSNAVQERLSAMREKEKATMAHFQALAKERFG